MLRPIEGVDKVDSSPCENGPLTNADCSYAGSAAYGDVLYECEVRIWRHKPLSGLRGRHLKIQAWSVQNLEFGSNAVCHAARWRLAGIDYLDFNDERVATVVRDDPAAAFDTKIGSQLSFGGFLGSFYKVASRFIQKGRSERENDRKRSNGESSDRHNLFTEIVDEGSQSIEAERERRTKGGKVFFWGVYCLIGLIGLLWWLVSR